MTIRIQNRSTIAPRTRTWEQIEVTGEHPAIDSAGQRVVQVIDGESVAAIASYIKGEASDPDWGGILIDKDHLSHDPAHSTEAMGWLMNAEVREGQLYGEIEWSDLGAGAVNNRRLQFFSTEYDAGDLLDLGGGRVRPVRLSGLALTNRPNNKGGRRITNRAADEAGRQPNPTDEPDTKMMKSIAEKLGLAEDATEEDILAAIDALQMKNTEAEVETILNRHSKRIAEGTRDEWKATLIANRKTGEALLEKLPELSTEAPANTPPAARAAITNREQAKTPDPAVANGDEKKNAVFRANRISNRASEIQTKKRISTAAAYREAEDQINREDADTQTAA